MHEAIERQRRGLSAYREARPVIAELGEGLRGVDGATARQALQHGTFGMLGQGGGNRRGQLLEVGRERGEDRDERAHDVAARLDFRFTDVTGGRAPEPQMSPSRAVLWSVK